MRTIAACLMVFLDATLACAQFSVGATGVTVKAGTAFSVDGMTLTATGTDLSISNNSIEKSTTPVPAGRYGSILRVYNFESPVSFSGVAAIRYLPTELNGNPEDSLQIAHAAEGGALSITSGSTVNTVTHEVSNNLTTANLQTLTATAENRSLPVTLIDFAAEARENLVFLRWSTSSESDADHFAIERSPDAKLWMGAGKVRAAGESNEQRNYQFTDTDAFDGVSYYRLKIVDNDGSSAYSTLKTVELGSQAQAVVYPNPAGDRLQVRNVSKSMVAKVEIFDISGRLVYQGAFFPDRGIALEKLNPGVYVLKLKTNNGPDKSCMFLKE